MLTKSECVKCQVNNKSSSYVLQRELASSINNGKSFSFVSWVDKIIFAFMLSPYDHFTANK